MSRWELPLGFAGTAQRPRALPLFVLLALGLAACETDQEDQETQALVDELAGSTPGTAPNSPPTISVTSHTTVLAGMPLRIVPTAADADGDALEFSAANLPRWASVESATGEITGTPGSADIGSYSGITITVSDGQSTASTEALSIDVVATASGSATLSWLPPTAQSDGTPLLDLAGFRVYWGTSADALTNSATIENPGITSYVVDQLTPATWYFTATAFNAKGIESDFAAVASKTIM